MTIEKLFELLSDNSRGLLLCKDELNTWIRSFTRYKTGGSGSDMPHWLELYQAGNLTIDRKTGERRTISIEHASVSVCGGIQPTVLAKAMTEEFFESGFVARLLMAMPPKKRKIWRDAVVGEQTLSDYEACLESLLGDSFGQSSNRILNLTEEARGIWITFYNESAVAQADADGAVAAMLSKLEGACARIALIHHCVSNLQGGATCIEAQSIRSAITLVRWFEYEARRIYSIMREAEADKSKRLLLEFIRSHNGSISARDLQRSKPQRFRTSDDATKALDNLVDDGLARWQFQPANSRGGPAVRLCVLTDTVESLTVDTTDETLTGEQ